MSTLPVVLSFGVSDPTGASGIQADQLAIASMGCHPASVITAIATAEDLEGSAGGLALETETIEAQAQSILQNMAVAAFKIGVIGRLDHVQPIAAILADYDSVPVVLDPVLALSAIDEDEEELAMALRELLIPQATVLAVNLSQARQLVGFADDEDAQAQELAGSACARELIAWGAEFVLITDAEPGSTLVVNALYDESGLVRSDSLPRVDTSSSRLLGAGDTLSGALAGLLAQGLDVPEAAQEASQYAAAALVHAFHAGIGVAVPDRLFWAGEDDDEDDGGSELN
jgi:hydroxymethylpyrimidine/phosphomethylpyrimidine kinase